LVRLQIVMPELPEVETVKNVLIEIVKGKTVDHVKVVRPQTVRSDVNQFIDVLKGATFLDFERVGKYIVYHLDRDYVLVSHLRMEGKYFHRENKIPLNHNDLVAFYFTDGSYLAFNDTRRFGTMELVLKDNYRNRDPLNKIGPDPFMMKDSKLLYEAFHKKGIAIKPCLLDQSAMSGLGNIYVDEVLFACKINPETPAKLITKEQFDAIWESSKDIMGRAIQKGGTTIISYHPREGINGEFRFELKVYGQNGGKCVNCGHDLRKTFVGGRGTTYCPHCQKNLGLPYIVGITGPVGAGKSQVGKYFEDNGFMLIDADKVTHELYTKKEIIEGIRLIVHDLTVIHGEIDRKSLLKTLLEKPNLKVRLEKYIHEQVVEEIMSRIKKSKKITKVAVEVPLLFESKFDDFCDVVLYVDVDEKTQVKHLTKRGSDVSDMVRLNKNFNPENKKKATAVITNNGTIANLNKQLKPYLR